MNVPENETEEELRYSEWIQFGSDDYENMLVTVEVPHRLSVEALKRIDELCDEIIEVSSLSENILSRKEADLEDENGSSEYWREEEGYEEIVD